MKHVAVVNKRIFLNLDGGVGMKGEICIYLLCRRRICLPIKLCVTSSTNTRSFVLEIKTAQCRSPRVPFEQLASKPHKSQTLRVVCNFSSSKLLCHYAWYCFM